MASGLVFGFECELYFNSSVYGTPVWGNVPIVKDASLDLGGTDADVSTRGSGGWKADAVALLEAGVEFEIVWDTNSTVLATLVAAYTGRTPIDCLILDGPVTTAGSQGLRATMQVMKFPRDEKLEDAVKVKVSMKPTYSANPPTWYTAT